MASAELTVAKAAVTGSLFRADPRPCSRDEIESMLDLLAAAITECSPPNVQKFKHWALSNLVPSTSRIAPFCKYLVALATSFADNGDKTRDKSTSHAPRVPSARRRRLHILYIVNDILFHVKCRMHDESFAAKIAPALPPLFKGVASTSHSPKHMRKVRDLIQLWDEKGYFDAVLIEKLRSAVEGVSSEDQNGLLEASKAESAAKVANSAPFIMPTMHGDPTTPWYDLPAGNWLRVLKPNSTKPMNPDTIKPAVLPGGPADKSLVEAVKKVLSDVDKIYSKEPALSDSYPDINQMGEVVEVDEITGDVIGGQTYYGWSRAFCEKMKARKYGGKGGSHGGNRGRNLSTRSPRSYSRSDGRSRTPRRSESRSMSPPAFKRPRLSVSPRSRHRDRSGDRSSSRSRSRSRDGNGYRGRDYARSRNRSRGRSRSRSRSQSSDGRYEPGGGSYARSRSRSRSPKSAPYSPPPPSGFAPKPTPGNGYVSGYAPPLPSHPMPYPPPPIPHQAGYGHIPIPPPPPPNYNGQWAPPPPPAPAFYTGAPPPPPPPVAPPYAQAGWLHPPPAPPAAAPSRPSQEQYPSNQGGSGVYQGGRGMYGRYIGGW
ncbi:hypothetical protein QBC47DRAFT_368449 [Echria macrotheca]|uniref:CID domain-containing protein n=1 Tax=Echria macrotheca TaxID=438768 RepID=A0AAJ0FGD7_9PEZI|nr:hypothetical protein QBC47DRAFT_368449 [Echria macrotheca]